MRTTLAVILIAALGATPAAQAQQKRVRTVIIEDEVITGQIQKPSVQILIARQDLSSADQLELRESFIPRIVKSVETRPF